MRSVQNINLALKGAFLEIYTFLKFEYLENQNSCTNITNIKKKIALFLWTIKIIKTKILPKMLPSYNLENMPRAIFDSLWEHIDLYFA